MPRKLHGPKNIKNATERIIAQMSEEDKQTFRGTKKDELAKFNFGLGVYIRNKFGLFDGNDALMKACALTQHGETYNIFYGDNPDGAAGVIIEAVWNELKSAA